MGFVQEQCMTPISERLDRNICEGLTKSIRQPFAVNGRIASSKDQQQRETLLRYLKKLRVVLRTRSNKTTMRRRHKSRRAEEITPCLP